MRIKDAYTIRWELNKHTNVKSKEGEVAVSTNIIMGSRVISLLPKIYSIISSTGQRCLIDVMASNPNVSDSNLNTNSVVLNERVSKSKGQKCSLDNSAH
jgi:hypothetical protein